MSKSNSASYKEESATILLNIEPNFGCTEGAGKINTQQFLEGAKHVVSIIERLGKIFAPLKYDMNGNITKITRKYTENTVTYQYLEDMILAEKMESGIDVTIDALQWLRRGLHFIARLFECILDDTAAGNNQQNLTPYFKVAYEEILERYHGWMGSQLFNIICRFAPNRKDLFQLLSTGSTYKEECVLKDMDIFKTNLLACVHRLINFYSENNLETHTRV